MESQGARVLIVDFASIEALVAAVVASVWAVTRPEDVRAVGVELARRVGRAGSAVPEWLRTVAPAGGLAALWLLCAMKLASRTYDPFLYFRF
jgi:hypothetical protein